MMDIKQLVAELNDLMAQFEKAECILLKKVSNAWESDSDDDDDENIRGLKVRVVALSEATKTEPQKKESLKGKNQAELWAILRRLLLEWKKKRDAELEAFNKASLELEKEESEFDLER